MQDLPEIVKHHAELALTRSTRDEGRAHRLLRWTFGLLPPARALAADIRLFQEGNAVTFRLRGPLIGRWSLVFGGRHYPLPPPDTGRKDAMALCTVLPNIIMNAGPARDGDFVFEVIELSGFTREFVADARGEVKGSVRSFRRRRCRDDLFLPPGTE